MKKIVILFLFLIFSFYIGIFFGSSNYSIFHLKNLSEVEKMIILRIRIPRTLCAFIVGAGLAVSGNVLQSILQNPLAESFTLGISGGASFGIAIGVILEKLYSIPFFSFLGGIISLLIILFLSIIKKFPSSMVILSGVSLNFIFSSLVLFLISVSKYEKFHSTILLLLGDLSSFSEKILLYGGIIIFLSFIFLLFSSRVYDILSINEEKAISLGVKVNLEKNFAYFLTCLISSICVSLSGIIGFVGLIVPHISRFFYSSKSNISIFTSFFIGGIFLILCDTLSRIIIRPVEIPVGVITGFFGGIFFLSLLIRSRKWRIF